MKAGSVRAAAATVLTELQREKTPLPVLLEEYRDIPDYPLLQELTYGSCRWFHLLDFVLSLLLEKPIREKDRDIHCLLITGLYQLRFLSVPDHAVLNETVNGATALHKPWAGALINGVLRNYLRRQDALSSKLADADTAVRHSHPAWLVELIREQWPREFEQILQANNSRPPLTLRVNVRQTTRGDYMTRLAGKGIAARPGTLAETAVYLDQPMPVPAIPGFAGGEVSVQDEASQLAPSLLSLAPGMRVLDACAAPGGKTAHLLESEDSLTCCLAIDRASSRVPRIRENLARLSLDAGIISGDASRPESWWDGIPFDRILLDAPCTAVGVIRRHPDIKLLRQPASGQSQPASQRQLLAGLWPTLAPGGLLLYTTCSFLRDENERLIEAFLAVTDNVKYESIKADWGVECKYGRQLLPAKGFGTDGFYFCLLRKT